MIITCILLCRLTIIVGLWLFVEQGPRQCSTKWSKRSDFHMYMHFYRISCFKQRGKNLILPKIDGPFRGVSLHIQLFQLLLAPCKSGCIKFWSEFNCGCNHALYWKQLYVLGISGTTSEAYLLNSPGAYVWDIYLSCWGHPKVTTVLCYSSRSQWPI